MAVDMIMNRLSDVCDFLLCFSIGEFSFLLNFYFLTIFIFLQFF